MPSTLTAYTHGCTEAPQVPGMYTQCVYERERKGCHRRRVNTHFCESLPWCGVDPHPWPSPPWIWQGLIRLIFHPARESGWRSSLHRRADKSNPTQFIKENIFHTGCTYLFWPAWLSPTFGHFFFSHYAFGKGHSLISQSHRTAVQRQSISGGFPNFKHRKALMTRHYGNRRVPCAISLLNMWFSAVRVLLFRLFRLQLYYYCVNGHISTAQ